MIDTHTHLDHELFNPDRDEVVRRAFENGIKKIITVGCDPQEMKEAIKLAEKYENIYVAIGFHPEIQIKNQKSNLKTLEKLLKHPKVVAIGEIGLDYFRNQNDVETLQCNVSTGEKLRNAQKTLFTAQLKLAQELDLPIIIHCRPTDNNSKDAYDDILEILRNNNDGKKLQGVIHCFCGTREHAKQFLDLGFHISFTGNITYFKKDDAKVLQVVREIPLNKILIETDCPFLSPAPHRGKRNEPMFVKYVAEKIAEIKEISVDEVEKVTDGNAEALFHIM